MLIYKSKKILIIASILLAVSLAMLVGLYFFGFLDSKEVAVSDRQDAAEVVGPCSAREEDSILSEAVALNLPAAYEDAEQNNRGEKTYALVERITKEAGYDTDANCLHILSMYYASVSDVENAEKYLNLLKNILATASPESYILDDNVNFLNQEQMQSVIDAAKYTIEQFNQNNPAKDQNRLDEKVE